MNSGEGVSWVQEKMRKLLEVWVSAPLGEERISISRTLLLLIGFAVACAGPPPMPIPNRDEPPPPSPLADALELAAQRPNSMRAMTAFEPQLEAIAEPIFEIRAYPDGPVSTSDMHPPPSVYVTLLPRRDDVLRSAMLRMEFTTSGRGGIPERNAWLVASPSLLEEPVNWGDSSQPVLQMIPFDVVLPFPAGVVTDYGPNNRFHRQPWSGLVEIADLIRLTAPLYLQLIVEAPEENWLGFVATHAYGLIPGGE